MSDLNSTGVVDVDSSGSDLHPITVVICTGWSGPAVLVVEHLQHIVILVNQLVVAEHLTVIKTLVKELVNLSNYKTVLFVT